MTQSNATNQQSAISNGNAAGRQNFRDFDQAARLLKLEEKYGNKSLRIEAAHESVAKPKSRVAKFKNYVDSISQDQPRTTALPQVVQNAVNVPARVRKPAHIRKPAAPAPMTQADSFAKNLKYASPEILATAVPATAKQKLQSKKLLAIPVDQSGLSLERLTRIDVPATNQIVATPKFAGKKKAKKAIRVTTSWKPKVAVDKQSANVNAAKLNPTSKLSTKLVAWEVNDFRWPEFFDSNAMLDTSTVASITNAMNTMIAAGNQRLAIVGSGRGPGTTTIAAYVARILAAQNKSVLLVDADLTKPDLTQLLRIPTTLSWTNIVGQQSKCSESIVRSCVTGVCMMPLAKLTNRIAYPDYIYDCLGGILDGTKRHFDSVIIDVGPTSQLVRELRQVKTLADGVMLVHNVRTPDPSTYIRNQNELNSFGVKNFVVAENFTTRKSA